MKFFLFLSFTVFILSCSKNATINPETLNGTYKGELWIYPWGYVMVYPMPITIDLNNGNWSAVIRVSVSNTKNESGTYSLTSNKINLVNSGSERLIPSSEYNYIVRGDSLLINASYSDGHPISAVKFKLKLSN